MAEFDPKKANNDDWGVIGGGAVVLVSSFLAWYGVSGEAIPGLRLNSSISGWDSKFLAVLGILLCTAAAAWVAYRVFGSGKTPDLPVGPNLLALILSGLGAILILLRLITFDRDSIPGYSIGPKYGVFLALAGAAVQSFFAFRSFKASGEQMAVDKTRMPGATSSTAAVGTGAGSAPGGWTAPPVAQDAPPPAYDAPPAPMDTPPMTEPPHAHDEHDGHDHPHA